MVRAKARFWWCRALYCRAGRFKFFPRHYVEDGHGTWPQPGDDSVMTPSILPVGQCNEGTVLLAAWCEPRLT